MAVVVVDPHNGMLMSPLALQIYIDVLFVAQEALTLSLLRVGTMQTENL